MEEAEPPAEMMGIPGMEDELRRPMLLLVKAKKINEIKEKSGAYIWAEKRIKTDGKIIC